MPISGPSSYLPTIEVFLAHWEDANDLIAPPVILPDGTTRANLVGVRDALEATRNETVDAVVETAVARATLVNLITTLQARVVEFNARVRADLAGQPIAMALPQAFAVGQAEDAVRDGLRKVSRLWLKVDALTPAPPGLTLPMTLSGGYTLADFDTDRDTLRDLYRALANAEVDQSVARAARNVVQEKAYGILKNYRLKIAGLATTYPSIAATLPALTPAPGSTPDAVTAHVVWDTATAKAKITWTASAEPSLAKYEIRGVAGDNYNTDDEIQLGTIQPDAAREFETDFNLTAPGLTSSFKVYVLVDTGNEKGSEAVVVTRPV